MDHVRFVCWFVAVHYFQIAAAVMVLVGLWRRPTQQPIRSLAWTIYDGLTWPLIVVQPFVTVLGLVLFYGRIRVMERGSAKPRARG